MAASSGTRGALLALLRFSPGLGFFWVGLAAYWAGVALGEKVTVEDLVEEVTLTYPEPARGSVGPSHDEVNPV
jgi:hypothetical protein